MTEMVCRAAGSPQKYTGRSMVDSHTHLKITSKEWEAFLDDFQQTLDKFNLAPTCTNLGALTPHGFRRTFA